MYPCVFITLDGRLCIAVYLSLAICICHFRLETVYICVSITLDGRLCIPVYHSLVHSGDCLSVYLCVSLCVRYLCMGWLRLVSSLKSYVSFAKDPYKRDYILQKRPIILRSLLIVALPYLFVSIHSDCISLCIYHLRHRWRVTDTRRYIDTHRWTVSTLSNRCRWRVTNTRGYTVSRLEW